MEICNMIKSSFKKNWMMFLYQKDISTEQIYIF